MTTATTWEETLTDPSFPPWARSVPWGRCPRQEMAPGMWLAAWSPERGDYQVRVVEVKHYRDATALTLSTGATWIVRGKEWVEYLTA